MINNLCLKAYKNACQKGWHDRPRSLLEELALVHSEVSEAVEEARVSEFLVDSYIIDEDTGARRYIAPEGWSRDKYGHLKPEGLPAELADTCIRIFDICGKMGIDLEHAIKIKMEYNETRPRRHGGKLY